LTRYESGRRAEWRCVNFLRSLGFAVTRSAASKGLWDVTVLSLDGSVTLIQVKRVKRGASWHDDNWRDLVSRYRSPDVKVQAWVYRHGSTDAEVYHA